MPVLDRDVKHKAWSKAKLVVHDDDCADCSGCVHACPHDAIDMGWRAPVIDPASCTLCGICVRVCPVNCLEIESLRTGTRVQASQRLRIESLAR